MKQIFAGIFALGLSAGAAWADTVQDVIGQQLDAFNARDLPTAFGFASPTIKRIFETPDNFGSMVARGFPMVWDNSDTRYLGLRADGASSYQQVMIRDQTGVFHVLEYKMIPVGDGWQIDGVQVLPAPQVGA
jgi:hypothetical protein